MTHIAELLQHLHRKLGCLLGAKCVNNKQITNFAKNWTIPPHKASFLKK